MKKSNLFIIVLLLNVLMGYSQITTNERPISVQRGFGEITEKTITSTGSLIDLPIPNMQKIYQEDAEREKDSMALQRTAVAIQVSLNMEQSGKWTTLKDGGKLWQLAIHAKDAKALDFVFDKFWLPEGGKFFIFNPDTKETIGAVTSKFLRGTKAEPANFSTAILKGDMVILEYYQPREINELPIINISKIYYSYRDNLIPVTSCSHNVNVNCIEGADWQAEKKAIALVYFKFSHCSGWGSGALVNNTQNNFTPLFLTANHNLIYDNVQMKDALEDSDLSESIFYWNFENPNCSTPAPHPYINLTTTGATLKANNPNDADFALLELTQSPWNLESNYIPYHLGWDRSGNSGIGGVCIHHPQGDYKKISTYSMTPLSFWFDFWGVQWIETPNGHGITEPISSGAPLINSAHKVIGQLSKGTTSCNNLTGIDKFGKLSVSWDGNGNTNSRRRLKDWLDPTNSNVSLMDGIGDFKIIRSGSLCSQAVYSIDYIPTGWSIVWTILPSSLSGLLQTNTPQTNQCTINNSGQAHIKGTLKAKIINCMGNIDNRTIAIDTGYGFTGTYEQVDNFNVIPNNIPPTSFSDGDTFIVGPKCDVYIRSTCLPGTTITHTGANLNYWNYSLDGSYGVIHLRFPYKTTAQHLTIKAVDNTNCKIYEFYVDALIPPLSSFIPTLSTSSDGQRLNITMGVGSEDDETAKAILSSETVRWDVMVCNAVTGKVMCENHVEGWSQEIDTTGWPSGIYVIKAQAGEHFVTQKVAIK
jgi:hypothetical protein